MKTTTKYGVKERNQREVKIQHLIDAATERYTYSELAKVAMKDEYFIDEIIRELITSNLSNDNLRNLIDIVEMNGCTLVECNSLAEEIKLEQFLSELKTNPYQLNLIN